MVKFLRLFLLGLLAAGSLPSAAALEWKNPTLEFTATPFQSSLPAAFQYTNTGAKPVRILAVESNCDCLDAMADRAVVAPGESGAIRTTFTIGDRLGLYERMIKVTTDDSPKPVRLLLRVEVPELAALAPPSVAWNINEPAAEKTVDLTVAPGLLIDFTAVQPTNGDFVARLETVEPGRIYRIHLKPANTTQPANSAFRLRGRASSGQEVVVSAYGNVR